MTPAKDNEERYDDILRRIANRSPFGSRQRETRRATLHERALDLVNAFDALARLARDEYEHYLCYGPKAIGGSAWSGAVIWYHRKGYHGYQTLYLLGVWAHYRDGEMLLSIGIRQLPYRAPVYDAGVYRVAIQKNFRIYYEDAAEPPGDDDRLLYRVAFQEKERLFQRRGLRDILQRWRREIEAG